MAWTILATALLVAVCTWCYIGIVRIKKERACKHNFQLASRHFDSGWSGYVNKFYCPGCGKVKSI